MSLGTSGLGAAGLAREGVGLGGAGFEAGAGAAPAADPDIDAYGILTANISSTLVANNHLTPYFNLDGDRVYFARGSSFQSFQYEMSVAGDMATLTGGFEGAQNWLFLSQFMRSIALTPDRSKAYKIRKQSGSDDQWISADPFSVAALGDPAQNPYALTNTKGSGNFTPPVDPGSFVVAPNNLDLFVAGKTAGDRAIYHHQMSVAGDASTATSQGQVLDLSSKFATLIHGIMFTPDGSKLFVLGDNGGTLSIDQFDLSTAYDVTTAVDSGKSLTVAPAQTINLSLFVWANPAGGFKLYLTSMPDINGTNLRVDTYESPAPVDPSFADVVLLLDFDGADGGTDITDLSNSGHVDTFFGDAEIDTAVTALGRNTVLLDGSGDYITFPDSADWDFGTGDFTVECHFQSNLNAVNGVLLSVYDAPLGWSLQHLSGAALRFLVGDTLIKSELFNPVEGTVFHVAVTRSGTDVRMFIDGVELGSATTDSTDLTGSTNPLTIGALAIPQQFVNGNIGAVRITKGFARYTANFTPPTVFYPTS